MTLSPALRKAASMAASDVGALPAADDGTPLFDVPGPVSALIEFPRIACSTLLTFIVIALHHGIPVAPLMPGLAATVGLTILVQSLVYFADGFRTEAFLSLGALIRALSGAAAIAIILAMGLRSIWPGVFAADEALAILLAFGLAGLVVERAAVSGRGAPPRSAILLTEDEKGRPTHAEDVRILTTLTPPFESRTLRAALFTHRPDIVLVTAPFESLDLKLVRTCALYGTRVLVLAHPLIGLAAGAKIVRLGGRPWIPLRPLPLNGRHRWAKRAVDVALVVISCPIVLPLMAVIGIRVAGSSPGGVLYRQTRIGEGGRPFILYKFRSMQTDAERDTGPVLALPDDPRVTRIGRFLRRTHLDELPQLWNVLRGQMSLVGPRPERPEMATGFQEIRDSEARLLLRPGLTGLAQLGAGYSAAPAEKLRWDLLYLSSYSIRLDLRLIAATGLDLLRRTARG